MFNVCARAAFRARDNKGELSALQSQRCMLTARAVLHDCSKRVCGAHVQCVLLPTRACMGMMPGGGRDAFTRLEEKEENERRHQPADTGSDPNSQAMTCNHMRVTTCARPLVCWHPAAHKLLAHSALWSVCSVAPGARRHIKRGELLSAGQKVGYDGSAEALQLRRVERPPSDN